MDVRSLIKAHFGFDLEISGRPCNSYEQTVTILSSNGPRYVNCEYEYLKYVSALRGVKWKILGQCLEFHDGKSFDVITIESIKEEDLEVITLEENYYFDISQCFK